MVKKRVGGAHRYKAGHKAAGAGEHEQQQQPQRQQDAGPKPPSHLQRKITKSVKFYEKVLSQPAPKALQVRLGGEGARCVAGVPQRLVTAVHDSSA